MEHCSELCDLQNAEILPGSDPLNKRAGCYAGVFERLQHAKSKQQGGSRTLENTHPYNVLFC